MFGSGMLDNLLEPAVLFFFLGIIVGAIRSNLEIPPQVTKFLSLYLLMAIGFKGGQSIAQGGLNGSGLVLIATAMILALLIPLWSFGILRKKVDLLDAAAIAATYGSVSAVTFVAATAFVVGRGHEVSGAMTVALVVMESPAIIMAVLLATWSRSRPQAAHAGVHTGASASMGGGRSAARGSEATIVETGTAAGRPASITSVLHEAFTDGAHLLLIGSLVIGAISGTKGGEVMAPFVGDLFKGLLAFFLLEMGLLVARQLREARNMSLFLVGFAIVMPVVNACVAIGLARLIGASAGNAIMLSVLAASGSYIVVPAVLRYAIPEAKPSRYFTMALGITFPFNIVLGIPLYAAIVDQIWR